MLGQKGSTKLVRWGLVTGDLLLLNAAFFFMRLFPWDQVLFQTGMGYGHLVLVANIAWLVSAYAFGIYGFYRDFRIVKVLWDSIRHLLLYFILIGAFVGFTGQYQLPGHFYFYLFGFQAIGVSLSRVTILYLLKVYRRSGHNFKRVAIAGYDDNARELRRVFRDHPEHGYRFIGYFDDEETRDAEVKGDLQELAGHVGEKKVDEVFCSLSRVGNEEVHRLIDLTENHLVRIKFLSKPRPLFRRNLLLKSYQGLPLLHFKQIPLDDQLNKGCKRCFDVVFSALVMIFVLSWLLPLLALIIRLDSKGPIFFKQKRTGVRNRSFWCYKLRTMYVNNEAHTRQATERDSRITPVGEFLRKTSLDELPQFFNVLMGDMSVVGPRPHMLKHTEEYSEKIDKFMVRHLIKPGITGLAQVMGYRGPTETLGKMERRARIDRFYVEHWNFLLDLRIVLQTVGNMFSKHDEDTA